MQNNFFAWSWDPVYFFDAFLLLFLKNLLSQSLYFIWSCSLFSETTHLDIDMGMRSIQGWACSSLSNVWLQTHQSHWDAWHFCQLSGRALRWCWSRALSSDFASQTLANTSTTTADVSRQYIRANGFVDSRFVQQTVLSCESDYSVCKELTRKRTRFSQLSRGHHKSEIRAKNNWSREKQLLSANLIYTKSHTDVGIWDQG